MKRMRTNLRLFFGNLPAEYKPVRVSCNVRIAKMEFRGLRKEIHWFWKTELNGITTQKKDEPE